MMKSKMSCVASRLSLTAAVLMMAPAVAVCAQSAPVGNPASKPTPAQPAQDTAAQNTSQETNRAVAYYHAALAGMYEDRRHL